MLPLSSLRPSLLGEEIISLAFQEKKLIFLCFGTPTSLCGYNYKYFALGGISWPLPSV